ncbi:hypothetical protein 7t3_0269 [Salmonella phage 7t3]|nr:hypothetical protein CPT_Munch_111 [Salmonella phage Munch]QCW18790.1 hypothetical protein 7t3_0269 [Salmonella phage 7t3]
MIIFLTIYLTVAVVILVLGLIAEFCVSNDKFFLLIGGVCVLIGAVLWPLLLILLIYDFIKHIWWKFR